MRKVVVKKPVGRGVKPQAARTPISKKEKEVVKATADVVQAEAGREAAAAGSPDLMEEEIVVEE